MHTGLGLNKKLTGLIVFINLFRFWMRKCFLGFEYANVFLKRVDKKSIQLILKQNGAKIGANCDVESGLTFHNCRDYSNLIIGNNCHIGKNCFFDLKDKVEIGNNVVISMQSTFITHQDLDKSELRNVFPASKNEITVKSNSYIGTNATILKGVVINEFSVVAAGSVVTKDVSGYSIVGGVPARLIKKIEESRIRETNSAYDDKN